MNRRLQGRGVDINPALAKSWSMLERLFRMTGDARKAAAAAERISSLKNLPPEVVRAAAELSAQLGARAA
jgi:hypothetical protein